MFASIWCSLGCLVSKTSKFNQKSTTHKIDSMYADDSRIQRTTSSSQTYAAQFVYFFRLCIWLLGGSFWIGPWKKQKDDSESKTELKSISNIVFGLRIEDGAPSKHYQVQWAWIWIRSLINSTCSWLGWSPCIRAKDINSKINQFYWLLN